MRVWTFGCSLTSFAWPTWADIIVEHCNTKGIQAENCGMSGSGNQAIVSKIMECHAKNNLGSDDYVLVCFSSFFRNDYYVDKKGWYLPGRVTQESIKGTSKKFKEHTISTAHYVIRDCTLISSVKLALESLGVKFLFWYWNDQRFPDDYTDKLSSEVLTNFQHLINTKIPDMPGTTFRDYKFVSYSSDQDRYPIPEIHPRPIEHFDYVKNVLTKYIDWLDTNELNNLSEFINSWEEKIDSYNGKIDFATLDWKTPRSDEWW